MGSKWYEYKLTSTLINQLIHFRFHSDKLNMVSKMLLRPRIGKGVQSKDSVARAVVKNISNRKFITVLTTLGKLNAFLQTRFPLLVERIIIRNLKKFEEGFK